MAMSLRPVSFHVSSTASEGLGAALGGSFLAISCARVGMATSAAASAMVPNPRNFFISLLRRHRLAGPVLVDAANGEWFRPIGSGQHFNRSASGNTRTILEGGAW